MKHTPTTCTHCIIISIKAKEKWWSIVNNSHKWVYNTEFTGTVCQDYFQCVILSHSIYEYSTFHSKIETNTHEYKQHNHEQAASSSFCISSENSPVFQIVVASSFPEYYAEVAAHLVLNLK